MTHSELIETVRTLVRQAFLENGGGPELTMRESILVNENLYCGRRFQSNELQAVWLIEEDEIKVRGPRGTIVQVIPVAASIEPTPVTTRKAA